MDRGPARIAIKNKLHKYYDQKRQRWVARSWPKGNGGDTPARARARAEFVKAVTAAKRASGPDMDAARKAAQNTTFLPRDVLMMAAYGRFQYWTMADGTLWTGFRMAEQIIQQLLDSIMNIEGVLLTRMPDGWCAILPPSVASQLTFDPVVGVPGWSVVTPDIQALLDSVANTPNDVLVRGASSWSGIDKATLANVQTVLNQLGPASGQVVKYVGSSWVAVNIDALFDAAGAAATALAAAKTYADGLSASDRAYTDTQIGGIVSQAVPTYIPGLTAFPRSVAARGVRLTPQESLTLSQVACVWDSAANGVYKIGIAPFSTATLKMTSAPAYSSTFTEGASANTAKWHSFGFATPFAMTAAQQYLVYLVRTDAGNTPSISMYFVSGSAVFPRFGLASLDAYIANTAPTTSDTWSSESGPYYVLPTVL